MNSPTQSQQMWLSWTQRSRSLGLASDVAEKLKAAYVSQYLSSLPAAETAAAFGLTAPRS